MTFLALMVAALLYYLWGPEGPLHDDGWFRAWERRVAGFGLLPWVSLTLLVLLPALVVAWLLNQVEPLLFGLFWIAAAVLLLLYAFGWIDYHTALERYADHCDRDDLEGAWLGARDAMALGEGDTQPETPGEMHDVVLSGLLFEGYQRWFPVVFWFLLLGPAGAFAYRLIALTTTGDFAAAGRRLRYLADFLPARALALTFALTGDFVRCRQALQSALPDSSLSAEQVLMAVGHGAVGARPASDSQAPLAAWETRETGALLKRSAGTWLVVISLAAIIA
jgi:AmpE protein